MASERGWRSARWVVLGALVGAALSLPQEGRAQGSGHRIVFDSLRGRSADIWSVRPDGRGIEQLTTDQGDNLGPAWSPDRTLIAFASTRTGSEDVFVMAGDGSGAVNLTAHPARDFFPAWAPDGDRIAFVSDRAGSLDIWVMDADGTDPIQLTARPGTDSQPTWSADGRTIAFTSELAGGIWAMAPDGSDLHRVVFGFTPAFAPAAESLAWTDRGLILVRERGGPPFRRVADPTGLAWPAWSPDGTEFAFQDGGGLYRVAAAGGPPVLIVAGAEVVFRSDW